MEPKRNKYQPRLTESSSSYRYKQIQSYKNRISELQKALQELVNEMNDPQKRKKYQRVIDAKVKKFRPLKKTSKFRGVSWHGPSETWRSRLHVGDEEVIDYHDTELGAAIGYDEKVKKYFPDRLYYKNFVDKDEDPDDLKPPKRMNVLDKRKIIAKHLSNREIMAIHPMGIGYFNHEHCEIGLKYIEQKEGVSFGR